MYVAHEQPALVPEGDTVPPARLTYNARSGGIAALDDARATGGLLTHRTRHGHAHPLAVPLARPPPASPPAALGVHTPLPCSTPTHTNGDVTGTVSICPSSTMCTGIDRPRCVRRCQPRRSPRRSLARLRDGRTPPPLRSEPDTLGVATRSNSTCSASFMTPPPCMQRPCLALLWPRDRALAAGRADDDRETPRTRPPLPAPCSSSAPCRRPRVPDPRARPTR